MKKNHEGQGMQAKVVFINKNRGMYAAEIDNSGEYVIFELLDSEEPDLGDVITHQDFYNMGGETFKNMTQSIDIEVYVENICGANMIQKCCLV